MFDRLREDIGIVFERDPAARSMFEILTTYPGIHAVLGHRLAHWLWGHRLRWLAKIVSNLARLFTGIEIHPGARIGRRFFIDHGMGVVIGETAEIGDDCTLYHGVTLGGTSWSKGKRHPTLGSDVIVGAGAKILGPIAIGDGARVGSNAVVLKEIPEGATVVGIPGRVVQKKGRDERRERIAKKMGFDAYGMTRDMPDPVAHAINCMLDHIHALDEKVVDMSATIRELGGQLEEEELPELDACEIRNSMDDDDRGDKPASTEGSNN